MSGSPKKTRSTARKKTRRPAPPKGKAKLSATTERASYHLPVRSESEQIAPLHEDLREAWDRLKAVLLACGPQDMRTSHRAIMFARTTCHAFVRPKPKFLETVFFLKREIDSPLIKRRDAVSKSKFSYTVAVVHRDQIDGPLAEWLREAYAQAGS